MVNKTTANRANVSKLRLEVLRIAEPCKRRQALDSWLEVATPGEVRKHWHGWMGAFPAWAKK